MIKVGIIGCGKIAQVRHLPEYADNENAEIAGVFDLNYDRAKEIAELYHTKAYASYEELLKEDIDAVSVCVANDAHAEITIHALEAGKHVLCEKPMAVTLEQCEKMVKSADETEKFLMIGHNQRLAKAHIKAKKLLEAGEIGDVIGFRSNFTHGGPETWAIDGKNVWFFDKNKSAFGAMADLGIHKTDLIQFLTGHTVKEVTAMLATTDKKTSDGKAIDVDDNAICIYKLDNGIIGTMFASWTCYGKEDNSTILYGTRGVMHIYDNPEYSIVIEYKDGTSTYYQVDQIQTNDNQTKSGIIDMWVDCLMNKQQPEISGAEVLKSMKAVFAALDSSRLGKTIVIN